ncbi:MAG TPA: phosphoglycerate kinase [Polyangia bacterium]
MNHRPRSVESADVSGKVVLVRSDLNVPLEDGHVADDTRIRASLPTLRLLLERGAAEVRVCSHLGRPKTDADRASFAMQPVRERLAELLPDERVTVLENTRFDPGETKNDPAYARELAAGCDLYVNDAFGSAHRAHASTEGITKFVSQAASGYLMKKELDYLGGALAEPRRPFVAIIGGSKVSGKIDVIKNMLPQVDKLLIGGGMTYTFLKAQGLEIGKSIVENDKLDLARSLLAEAGDKLVLGTDCVVTDKLDFKARTVGALKTVKSNAIPSDWEAVDVGPETSATFAKILLGAKTIIWNGPVGVFEIDATARGTMAIAQNLADATAAGATTIIGGGDSASAVKKAGVASKVSHVSTGGGASLEFLEGKILPGVAALTNA